MNYINFCESQTFNSVHSHHSRFWSVYDQIPAKGSAFPSASAVFMLACWQVLLLWTLYQLNISALSKCDLTLPSGCRLFAQRSLLAQQTLTNTSALLFFTEPNDAGIMRVSLDSIDSRSVHLTETIRADGWFIQICRHGEQKIQITPSRSPAVVFWWKQCKSSVLHRQ